MLGFHRWSSCLWDSCVLTQQLFSWRAAIFHQESTIMVTLLSPPIRRTHRHIGIEKQSEARMALWFWFVPERLLWAAARLLRDFWCGNHLGHQQEIMRMIATQTLQIDFWPCFDHGSYHLTMSAPWKQKFSTSGDNHNYIPVTYGASSTETWFSVCGFSWIALRMECCRTPVLSELSPF